MKQAKAKKTSVEGVEKFFNAWNGGSVSGVLEQMESNNRGRTAQMGIFRRIEGGFLIH